MLACAASCGSQPPGTPPDGPTGEGHELSIALYRHTPFVEGDTAVAPLVAIQDGDGRWAALASGNGVYRAHLSSERYGVAIGCGAGGPSRVSVFQRTVADGLELRTRSCDTAAIELDVAVRHVPAGAFGFLSTAAGSAGGGDSTYAFFAQPGPTELFGSLSDSAGNISKLVRLSSFDLQARQAIAIDFAAQGSAPIERGLVIALGPADLARVTTSVVRPTGEYPLHVATVLGTPPAYQVLPLALREPDDLFSVAVQVDSRTTAITTKVPDALALQLPPAVSAQQPTLTISPRLSPAFSFTTAATDLAIQTYVLSAQTAGASDGPERAWSAELTASWIAGAPELRYAFPDLSAVPGFAPELALLDRGPLRWSVRRKETSAATPSDGRITRSAVQSGVIDGYCGDHVVQPDEACDPPDSVACSASCSKQ